ncbi:MAG: ATP-binding protein [Clostridia bacterium]|nr:ATP-binding protein [Clostridia bacterium]
MLESIIEFKKEELIGVKKHIEEVRPVIIEFTGTPDSGKTTTINHMKEVFDDIDFPCTVIEEPASYCPIEKMDNNDRLIFNTWTFGESMNKLNEAAQKESGIILCDRGIYDNFVWFEIFKEEGIITSLEHGVWKNLLNCRPLNESVNYLYNFITSPDVSLGRKRTQLADEKVDKYIKFLSRYNEAAAGLGKLNKNSRLIDTDGLNVNKLKEKVEMKLITDIGDYYKNSLESRGIAL